MNDLSGRVALVSGASSGLGAHFARLLASAGAKVVLAARRASRIDTLVAEIGVAGGTALAVTMDVTDEVSVQAAYDAAESRFGVVDTIIANAGVAAPGRSTDIGVAAFRSVLDTNVLGVVLTAREGARRLIAARATDRGRIVLIGSINACQTGQGDSLYGASKAAVAQLGRNLAREWVRQGVNVNVVQPGYILTELAEEWFASEGGKTQVAGFHRRRLQPMESLDPIMLYLCSQASAHMTGTVITLDDGQSL